MSAREPLPSELPNDDAPSPEVLDELLRAFAADGMDPARLDEVDFSSPEVADLLTPTPRGDDIEPEGGATDSDGDDVGVVEPEVDEIQSERGDADAHGADDGEGEPEAEEIESAGGAADSDSDGGEGDADHGEVEAEPDERDAGPGSPAHGADRTDGAGIGGPGAPAPGPDADGPTPDPDEPEAGGVAGDPFLGGARLEESDVAPAPPGPRTIAIVDEGLPDPVYLGSNLEPTDTSRSTVMIEDHGGSAILSVEEASSATHIEPRLQDRRQAVKKAANRKRFKWGILVTVLVLLVVAALAVLGSGLFAIEDVRVQGAERTDPEALAAVIADLEGTPVLRADTAAAERELEQLPWVEDARVTTDFPDGATIELRERTPAAVFQAESGEWRLVDDSGRVLEVSAEEPPGYLPIRGTGFPEFGIGQYGPPGLAAAATLARSLTPTVAARSAEITVAPNASDLRLHFADGAEVRFGAADELVQKLVRLETKLNDLGAEHVNYIDVSTNEVGQG